MQTDRYNLFIFIHKGIRRELSDLLRIAGSLDFTDREAARNFTQRLRLSLRLMHEHAEHEDRVIDPLLQQFAPKLARRVLSTHRVLGEHENELHALCEAAIGDPASGYRLYLALSRYAATQYAHMSEEETEVIGQMWLNMSDEEVIAAENSIVKGVQPQDVGVYFTWMLHGINEAERVAFIEALRKGAPPEAVAFAEEQARAAREAQLAAA